MRVGKITGLELVVVVVLLHSTSSSVFKSPRRPNYSLTQLSGSSIIIGGKVVRNWHYL